MSINGRPLLGIDISASEIRVVEMHGRWQAPQIARLGMVPTPPGAVEDDHIVNPTAVGEALRDLLERMGAGTREAILGMSPRDVITRILDIPRVPDKEARTIIEGELAHYQIMQEGIGSFDFLRLHDPGTNFATSSPVLMMAAEGVTVSNYMTVASVANLRLIALEPTLLSLYRAVYSHIQLLPAALCLSISYGKTEIAIIDQGTVRLYRRVDIGSDDLISGRQRSGFNYDLPESGMRARRSLAGDDPKVDPDTPDSSPKISIASATNLAMEVQRSLDYYRREYPQANGITRTFIATNDLELEPLVAWLRETLRLDVEIARLPVAPNLLSGSEAQLNPTTGIRYLGAAGLAMRTLSNQPDEVPHFDLATQQRGDLNLEYARRKLSISMVASIAIMLLGIGVAFGLGTRANHIDHELYHETEELEALQKKHRVELTTLQTRQEQLQALTKEGLPFLGIMDSVTKAVATDAGLLEVTLDQGGRLTLDGEATNDKAIISTLEGMKTYPCFVNPSLDSFDSDSNSGKPKRVLRFKISSLLVGVKRPDAAGTTPNGGTP
jgi:type IV pilus assembly protein PilM